MTASRVCILAVFVTSLVSAQPNYYWRNSLSALPQRPLENTTAADVLRFERDMRVAAPYLSRQNPADSEANRVLVRRMAVYLATLQVMARDPQMRAAVGRAQATFNTFGLLPWLAAGPATGLGGASSDSAGNQPQAPATRRPLPFNTSAPVLSDIDPSEKTRAEELADRYETDAGRAAGLWYNAESLRQTLAGRGMSLNPGTAASVLRMTSYLDSANADLRQHAWDEAGVSLQRAEAEAEKIARTLGR